MINYRYYQGGDEKQIVQLWNKCLKNDPITKSRFRKLVLLDANFDPQGLRLAFKNDQLIGCVYAIRRLLPMFETDLEPENGWITFFFVDEKYRRSQIGTKLLDDALHFLKKNDRKYVFFSSYAPNYIVPGIDEKAYPEGYEFLKANGFSTLYSPIAMDRDLTDYEWDEVIQERMTKRIEEGYTFQTAQDKDLYELIQFANIKFNPDWGRAIREGLLQGLPMKQILVAKKEEKIVGFCMFGGYEGIRERFGPFGVDPDERGKGLGKILLHLCLQQMKAIGLHGAWFLWTGEETPAGYLYKDTGFEVTRQFHVMQREI